MMLRHVPFLKNVFLYSITAFGGPQAHIAMMMKMFVNKTPYITKEELLEYNAFCNLLPGASSTQTVTLIGYKRGGVPLAVLTLLVWIAPACVLMGAFSFLLPHIDQSSLHTDIFKFIPALAVGFLLYASIIAFEVSIVNTITWIIMLVCIVATYLFFKTPWIFPLLIVLGGVATNLSHKRIPQIETHPQKIKWWNIWLFAIIFLIAGVSSELARTNDWPNRKPVNLFENTYRMGSLVFGGGHVLMPMMYEQYSVRPEIIKQKRPEATGNIIEIDKDDMITGMGIVRAMPGPVFSIFLPSALLVLFFFPIWNNLKKFAAVYRSLEGINAAVVGIMIASTLYIMKDISLVGANANSLINIAVIVATFLLLQFTKIAAPFIVVVCLLLGYFF
jgi:chromate transporter